MKHWLTILLTVLTTTLQAQQRFEATVVDAQTDEVLPFASVYVDSQVSTITNAEGTFALSCQPADTLRITYVGYKSTTIQASLLRNVVRLEPQALLLHEVTVVPIGPMVNKICKETLRMRRKHAGKKSHFYYRQTAFSDSTCYEFVEAFLKGGAAVALHDLKLQSGRYAGLQSDDDNAYAFFGNFFTFSQLEVAETYAQPLPDEDVVPLFRNYDKFYDLSYNVKAEGDDRIFIIHFEPKPDIVKKYAILGATLYVDEKTLHLRRIVGTGYNFRIRTKFTSSNDQGPYLTMIKNYSTDFSYVIDLTEDNGFPEVQSAFVEAVYEADGKTITTRSLLYNLGNNDKKRRRSFWGRMFNSIAEQFTKSDDQDLSFGSVLHKKIEQQGYDPEFWSRNEIVRRTPIEQEVMELFEQQNLFGVFQ